MNKKQKINDYDKENDILFIRFGKQKYKESIELNNVHIVLDLDKNLNIIGFEIFDYMQRVKEHGARMEKIFGSKKK